MKIAQIAPLYESVPPKLYGGTERIVHYLTEELVRQGHEVTLFASGDSFTSGRLITSVEKALRLDTAIKDPLAHHIVEMQDVIDQAREFDILHFHTDYLHFPFSQLLNTPAITTLHGTLDIPDLQAVYNKFPQQMVVSISDNQRKPLPQANWLGTVYHGLPIDLHTSGDGSGEYLAFLGRVSPEKGLQEAIQIAIASNTPLKIAAKVNMEEGEEFDLQVRPSLDHPLIEFVGEINEVQKNDFLGKAKALLFPIKWAEPFGLVMIEAMACGTPVIAFANGSVTEVIDEGESGFVVTSVKEATKAVSKIDQLSRSAVRAAFDKRFTSSKMTASYVHLYRRAMNMPGNTGKQNLES